MNKHTRTRLILFFLILGILPSQLIAQFSCKDTVFTYVSYDTKVFIDEDTLYPVSYQVSRKCIGKDEFVEITDTNSSHYQEIDTFLVQQGEWFKKFNGQFQLFFSEKKFQNREQVKICYNQPDIFGVRDGADTIIYQIMTPISVTLSGIYIFEVYDPFFKKKYQIHFDPNLGITQNSNMKMRK